MSTSALPTFISSFVSSLQSYSPLAQIRIFDGTEIDMSFPGDAIAIGHDGSIDGDDVSSGSARQEYIQLGAKSKFEEGTVSCVLWSANGLTNLSDRRTQAYTLLGAVESLIRSDVSFGGVVLYSSLDSHQMIYRQTDAGAAVVIQFTVTYKAKI